MIPLPPFLISLFTRSYPIVLISPTCFLHPCVASVLHFVESYRSWLYAFGLGGCDSMAATFQTGQSYLGLEPRGVIVSRSSNIFCQALADRLPSFSTRGSLLVVCSR